MAELLTAEVGSNLPFWDFGILSGYIAEFRVWKYIKTNSTEWMWIQYSDYDIALSMRLRHYRTIRYDRANITVVAYEKLGPSTWEQIKIDYLYSRIEADFRARNDGCGYSYSDSAQHSCTNCKVSSRRIKNPRRTTAFCDGDIKGFTGGTYRGENLWEVSKTFDGFECCD